MHSEIRAKSFGFYQIKYWFQHHIIFISLTIYFYYFHLSQIIKINRCEYGVKTSLRILSLLQKLFFQKFSIYKRQKQKIVALVSLVWVILFDIIFIFPKICLYNKIFVCILKYLSVLLIYYSFRKLNLIIEFITLSFKKFK